VETWGYRVGGNSRGRNCHILKIYAVFLSENISVSTWHSRIRRGWERLTDSSSLAMTCTKTFSLLRPLTEAKKTEALSLTGPNAFLGELASDRRYTLLSITLLSLWTCKSTAASPFMAVKLVLAPGILTRTDCSTAFGLAVFIDLMASDVAQTR